MIQKIKEYIELAIVSILSALVYLYVVHPILEDINPILTFNSNGVGLGIISMTITITVLSVAYSITKPMVVFFIQILSIIFEYVRESGVKLVLADIGLLFLIRIPNEYLPEKYHPENIDLQELEKQHK